MKTMIPIPHAALSQHIIALGKTGSGKSSKLRVLVEAILDDKEPVCILDPKGDWWGLKSSADGRRSGYPIVIFGGEHADVPLNAHAGAHVAELVATGNRSCLIDLGGWMVGDRTRFFIDFAATLFKMTRGARHLVIDEVHNFAPQGKIMDPDAGRMLHWANRLASEGRGKGLTIVAASQRPQKVHKDFLTSCETLIACKVIHKLDRDSIKDWIDGCADPAKGREVLASLAQMKKPEAWCWTPELDFGPELVTFPLFKTYDSFKPQAADAGKLTGWAEVDLDQVKAKLATVVEEAKKNDPRELNRKIDALNKEVISLRNGSVGTAERDSWTQQGHASGYAAGLRSGIEHAGVCYASMRREIEDAIASFILNGTRELQKKINEAHRIGAELAERPVTSNKLVPKPAAVDSERRTRRPVDPARVAPAASSSRQELGGGSLEMPLGQAKVLAALIQYPKGLTREQLTVLAGYKKSTRDLYLQQLQRAGLVEIRGSNLVATDAGIGALPDAEPLPTGAALRDHWLAKLPAGERKILEVLIEAYPDAVPRDEISTRSGYLKSTRDLYIQQLARRQLCVPGRGEVRASEDLFS
jgi:hypothetical protein